MPEGEYVFRTEAGGYRVVGTRVSFDSVVLFWKQGQEPETLVRDFPTLTLEKVHGVLAFYHKHQAEFDQYLADQAALWEKFRLESEERMKPLLEKMRARAAALAR